MLTPPGPMPTGPLLDKGRLLGPPREASAGCKASPHPISGRVHLRPFMLRGPTPAPETDTADKQAAEQNADKQAAQQNADRAPQTSFLAPPLLSASPVAAWQVTTAVQYLVEDGRLNLHGPSRAGLPGFYDPAPGQDKALYVLYRFKVRAHARECVRGVGGWRESERDRESERLIM